MIAAPQQSQSERPVKSSTSAEKISQTIERALDVAGLLRGGGPHDSIRSTIDNALQAAGLVPSSNAGLMRNVIAQDAIVRDVIDAPANTGTGRFISCHHSSAHGSRSYKLYVPCAYGEQDSAPMPLIVMLHGCKQNPDDFAAGTRMNALAEQHGFLVAYPAQTARANGSNCWNWFDRAHQQRAGVEPSLLAGIVADVTRTHNVDDGRIFVAGLSAGAAMAVILGREYPDLFTAVAVHSGLPAGAAHDVPSAFAAMRGQVASVGERSALRPTPTIVFHGDIDATVSATNGAAVVGQAVSAFEHAGTPLQRLTRVSCSAGGKRCTVTRFVAADSAAAVEEWVVHGGGHAWFGGSVAGSYTEPAGPDASAEIVRFFLAR
jgi:poly(hydroxyalkanoate) depolymerase family esterase